LFIKSFLYVGDPREMVKNENYEVNTEKVLIGVADDDGSCGTNAITGKTCNYRLLGSF